MPPRTAPHPAHHEALAALRTLPLATGLSEGELATLSEYLTSASYPKGKVVFEQGGRRDALLLITQGRLSIYKEFGDAPEVFAVLHPGNFCCEEALTDQRSVHSKSGQALDELKTLELTYTAFRALSSEHPRLAIFLLEKLLQSVAERLHHTDNRLITLYHTGRIISITLPLEEMGRQILAALHEVIRAKRSLFVSFLPSLNRILLLAHYGFAVPPFGGEDHIPLSQDPVLGLIAANNATILVTRDSPLPHTVDVAYTSPSMVGVPIKEEGKTIGAILMLDKQNDEFNLNNVMLLEIVARQIAGAITEGEALHRHQAEEELKRVYIRPF
ncbi:MAG: cyclic nucleotide-binding domain-containing protein [Patescibacteria group bacterium]